MLPITPFSAHRAFENTPEKARYKRQLNPAQKKTESFG
jgi:hypothetical protein